jgi:hypothetical protein
MDVVYLGKRRERRLQEITLSLLFYDGGKRENCHFI